MEEGLREDLIQWGRTKEGIMRNEYEYEKEIYGYFVSRCHVWQCALIDICITCS